MLIDAIVLVVVAAAILVVGWISYTLIAPTVAMFRSGSTVRVSQAVVLPLCMLIILALLILLLLVLVGVPTPWGAF